MKVRVLIVAAAAAWVPSVASAALVVHWKLDETSGTDVADSAGTAQNGVLQNPAGGVPNWVPGFLGNGYQFTGGDSNEVIRSFLGAANNNSGPNGSWGAWVNKSNTGGGVVIGMADQNVSQFQLYAEFGLTGVTVDGVSQSRARISKRNAGLTVNGPVGTTMINDGAWHHIIWSIDWIDGANGAPLNNLVEAAEQTRRVYVDGKLEGEFAETMSRINLSRFSVGAIHRGNSDTVPSSTFGEFSGIVDDVGYWNSAIDAVDIALIHGLGRFSSIDLSDPGIAAVRDAWTLGTGGSATAGSQTWYFTEGLTGVTGQIGGTVEDNTAFIVLDGTTGTGVSLVAPMTSIDGDADGDGDVDFDDLGILLGNYDLQVEMGTGGDSDGDGDVDFDDLGILLGNYGFGVDPGSVDLAAAQTAAASVVPEPSSLTALLPTALLLRRRRA